ncbi:(2Z,6Z)-farnesyl diphosphate synthase CPT6, chloroplastic-like isoform X2 [Salvia miltiorrhiza]|uniref:(2Z,6Z)-farnesyl diphosphate synthase CPT6, chloroplastic-like isoform X2 n=1 Tax=Salvia miltiorrhiza TaxID=226208 RepID=UPI0025AD0946|nr:(2Z,6Z)-farnesyl diphosphate synthase CPT6, chloroplastic-like isoform X2 [Salvia miltiorrhiza]
MVSSLQWSRVVPAVSMKAWSTAGKRSVEGPNASSPALGIRKKACLAVGAVMMPKHVGIIMDGSGRWAQNRNLPIRDGHRASSQNLTGLISSCCELGINTLTIFTFSKDNWKRSQMEVDILMRVFEDYIQTHLMQLVARYDIQFAAIGNKSILPKSLQNTISWAEEISKGNKGMNVVMAVSYSGRDDVVEATKNIATKVELGIIRVTDIDEIMFEQELMTNILEFPNPDLLIRTSGELRISNFLLWQLAYTEFYFVDKLFPDFSEDDLHEAFASYQCRERRYGERRN